MPRLCWVLTSVVLEAGCASTTTAVGSDGGTREDIGGDVVGQRDAVQCVDGEFTLTRVEPEVLLVLDRSGSMALGLAGEATTPTRWDALRGALVAGLTPYDSTVTMGVLLFPDPMQRGDCAVGERPTVVPGRRSLGAILGVMNAAGTAGRTPTWAALQSAGEYVRSRGSASGRSMALVLATDGAPNCNGSLDGQRCTCTGLGGTGQQSCEVDPALCLDDQRTVSAVLELSRAGVATYVIGIDGDDDPTVLTVLDRLATAGGRPRLSGPTGHRYYSVRRAEELTEAFGAIQRAITLCELVAPERPGDDEVREVTVDGVAVLRDRSRANGWDWTTAQGTMLGLYGAACERLSAGAGVVRVRFGCRP